MNEQCVFCRIIAGEETVSIVHEDDRAVAFMDIQPASPGHVLVVSREHHADLFDTPQDLAAHCLAVAQHLEPGIRQATGASQASTACSIGTTARRAGSTLQAPCSSRTARPYVSWVRSRT